MGLTEEGPQRKKISGDGGESGESSIITIFAFRREKKKKLFDWYALQESDKDWV
jgi:hypothetical protein